MLFNSFEFFLFFPIVTAIYFALPHQFRWFHLLAASCLFYMCFVPVYILILFFTIVVDYVAGILIENATGARRRWFLVMSIVANVGVLAFFKYYNFFAGNVNLLFHLTHAARDLPFLNIILPIGLSFHTFQAMSYTIEVYRGNQKAERHFGIYALYVMFYPQLVAGPIERPQNLLHQFHERHGFDYHRVVSGLRLMMWGLIKKVVIADRIALLCNPIYSQPGSYSGVTLAVAAFFFTFQIYCDFSGYSDIALGSAQVMGFKLMVNFDSPFHSRSITEFWRRWHISLSTWFYDYVFNPVITALRHWEKKAIAFGLLLTFFLSGFWHGAGWKFIIYGIIHGVAIVYEFYTRKFRKKIFKKLPKALSDGISICITFCYVSFSWIFFRAATVADAFLIIRKIGGVPSELMQVIRTRRIAFLKLPGIDNILLPCLGLVLFLEFVYFIRKKFRFTETFDQKPIIFRWSLYYLSIFALIYFGVYQNLQFIYFQF